MFIFISQGVWPRPPKKLWPAPEKHVPFSFLPLNSSLPPRPSPRTASQKQRATALKVKWETNTRSAFTSPAGSRAKLRARSFPPLLWWMPTHHLQANKSHPANTHGLCLNYWATRASTVSPSSLWASPPSAPTRLALWEAGPMSFTKPTQLALVVAST